MIEYYFNKLLSMELINQNIQPEDEKKNNGSFKSDKEYRNAVFQYEADRGLYPEQMSENHPGYDIESYDAPSDFENRKIIRKIEVKGRTIKWEGNEIVTLSYRQLCDFINDDKDEYWLYIVFKDNDSHFIIYPIKNPVRRTKCFDLKAAIWGWSADTIDIYSSVLNYRVLPDSFITPPYYSLIIPLI